MKEDEGFLLHVTICEDLRRLERNFFMERIYTVEVSKHVGERVRITGWLRSPRRLGGVKYRMG